MKWYMRHTKKNANHERFAKVLLIRAVLPVLPYLGIPNHFAPKVFFDCPATRSENIKKAVEADVNAAADAVKAHVLSVQGMDLEQAWPDFFRELVHAHPKAQTLKLFLEHFISCPSYSSICTLT